MTTDLFFKEVNNKYISINVFFYLLYFETISHDYLGNYVILIVFWMGYVKYGFADGLER